MSVSGNDAQASNDADDGGSSDALSAAECGPEGAAEALLSEFPADDEYADQVRRFMLLCMTSALLLSS